MLTDYGSLSLAFLFIFSISEATHQQKQYAASEYESCPLEGVRDQSIAHQIAETSCGDVLGPRVVTFSGVLI
jgi:hypothetical protein